MAPVFVLIFDWAFVIGLVITVYFAFKGRKQKERYKSKLTKSAIFTGSAFLLFMFSTQFLPETVTTDEKEEAKQSSVKTKPKAKSSNNSSEEEISESTENGTDDDNYTSTQIKAINKQLVLDLEDDQNSAINGDSNYNWAPYILKIQINKNKTANVYVDGDFMDLSESDRQIVGQGANGLIGRSIVTAGIDYTPEEGREGVYLSFYNGPQAIGHSRFTDHSNFKWYKH